MARQALLQGADLILAVGGDGTINEVANGMIGSQTPLAILPAGTANVLAMEMRLGGNLLRAARLLSRLEPVRIAVGLLREPDGAPRRHFLLMAGAGLDAAVVCAVQPELKNRLGKLAYWLAASRFLFRRLEEFTVRWREGRLKASFALASRVRNYGGDLRIARKASLLRDSLQVYLFEGRNALRYLLYFAGVLCGAAHHLPGVRVFDASRLALEPAEAGSARIQLDGEDCGPLPVVLEIVPDALTLLCPPEFLARERSRWTT